MAHENKRCFNFKLQLSIHKNLQWELWIFLSFFTKRCVLKTSQLSHRYGFARKISAFWSWASPTSASKTKQIHSSKACTCWGRGRGAFNSELFCVQNWEFSPSYWVNITNLSKTTTYEFRNIMNESEFTWMTFPTRMFPRFELGSNLTQPLFLDTYFGVL